MSHVIVIKKKAIIITVCLITSIAIITSVLFSFKQDAFATSGKVDEGIKVPILMYHCILKDLARQGPYVISPDVFKNDMLYLKQHGYTTVFVSDLIDYVYNNKPLPKKPVVVTLDDGYLNNITYILPILEETDTKAVISIIGVHSELYSNTVDRNNNYAHLTWDDIKQLDKSKHVEIGNHTYNMHDLNVRQGCKKKSSESVEQYQAILKEDVSKTQQLLKDNSNVVPQVFTYPFGYISPEALPVLKDLGFKAALICEERVNTITKDPETLYHLGRYNRPSGISTEQFMKKIMA